MPFFWYVTLNNTTFEGTIFDGSLEDIVSDIYYWEGIGIIDSFWYIDYES